MKVEICDRCHEEYGERGARNKMLLIIPNYILRYRFKKIEMCDRCFEDFMGFTEYKPIKLKNK